MGSLRHVEVAEACRGCCTSRRVEANLGVFRRVEAAFCGKSRRFRVLRQVEAFSDSSNCFDANRGQLRVLQACRGVSRLALASGVLRQIEAFSRLEANTGLLRLG